MTFLIMPSLFMILVVITMLTLRMLLGEGVIRVLNREIDRIQKPDRGFDRTAKCNNL